MRTIVAIGIAGALGALARYGLDGVVSRRLPTSFPWGTFVVNISGALVLGFLGAYTTFSTLQYETYRLLEDGAVGLAAANVFGSAAAGLFAVYLGVVAGRAL